MFYTIVSFSPTQLLPGLLIFYFSLPAWFQSYEYALDILGDKRNNVYWMRVMLGQLIARKITFPCCCFCSVAQSCPTLCDLMGCSTPGFPVLQHLLDLAQTHVHWVGDAIQPSHSLSSPYPPAFNLPQNQGLFQWVSSCHQVVKVLELQVQYQPFQWAFRTDFL